MTHPTDAFTNNEITIQKGDCIYMFSDGYIDQFGGPKGRKFLRKNLNELLLNNHEKHMASQKFILEETLEKWKGSHDQIDDICVFGARL